MGAFRVLITGGVRSSCGHANLALDALLANRLHDVVLLTVVDRGVTMLAASYAADRNLALTPLVADFRRCPADAPERRDACLVAMTDAAVVVRDDHDPAVRLVLQLVEAKGIPVHVIGAGEVEGEEGSLA